MPDSLIPIIIYEVYHPTTKKKLDLKDCKDVLINYNIPISIDENNLFKYDPESEYYTDICFPFSTENDTDILINDRHTEFNDNNMSICENNCTIKNYDNEKKNVICDCKTKTKDYLISELFNNTDILTYNFKNKEDSSNMVTMKCYYTLFTKEGLKTNIGNYIILFIILLFIISAILFYKCGYPMLENDIREIIKNKNKGKQKKRNVIKKIKLYLLQ